MHVEAHRLPVIKFRRLRRRFELAPLAQDWHDLFHPVTPSPRRLDANLRDKLRDNLCINPLSGHTPTALTPGSLERRQYTDQQKLAIIAEASEPGVPALIVACRHGVTCR